MITLNRVNHWYRIAGTEHSVPPLLIIHGGPGGNVYNFERTIGPRLEAFAPVIYFEQRGCGRSEPPPSPDDYSLSILTADLEALCQALGLDKVIPLGFSFGGELALEFALAYPARVDGLILQAPSFGDRRSGAYVQLNGFHSVTTGELKRRIEAVLREDGPPEDRLNAVWSMVDTETVDRFLFQNREVADLNRRMWRESGLRNTGDMMRALFKHSVDPARAGAAATIQVPALVLVGLYDRNIGVDACRDLCAHLPQAQLVVFGDSAHFPDMEEPEAYASAIRQFMSAMSASR